MACFYEHRIYAFVTLLLFLFTNEFAQGSIREWVKIGTNASLGCVSETEPATWIFKNESINAVDTRFTISADIVTDDNSSDGISKYNNVLHIRDVVITDIGSYTCKLPKSNDTIEYNLQPFLQPKVIDSTVDYIKRKIGHSAILYCVFDIYPQNMTLNKQLKWLKDGSHVADLENFYSITQLSETRLNFTLEFTEVYKKENGTYKCVLYGSTGEEIVAKEIALLVMEVPQISIDYVKAVGANKIFLNWTSYDGNDPVQKFFIQYAQAGSSTFEYYKQYINGNYTSYVLDNFKANTTYHLRITGKNSIGDGTPNQYPFGVTTLDHDPTFIPKVETTGSTASTITIGWNPPSQDLIEFIQYYELTVSESGEKSKLIETVTYQQNSRNLPYMFDKLKTATDYKFQVRACSDLTKTCGNWSEIVNGTTMDGVATKPMNLTIHCNQQNNSRSNSVSVGWGVPKTPNGKIVSYLINLEGNYTYNQDGIISTEKWGPTIRRVDEPSHKASYENVSPNTNYTVTVSAITRHKKTGEPAVANCFMPISTPETIGKTMWTKVKNGPKYVLKLYLPKVSERNGPICCYRLYLVKIVNGDIELPPPAKLNIATFNELSNISKTHNHAYLAEMLSTRYFKSEIFLGDEMRFSNNLEDLIANDEICRKCLIDTPFYNTQRPISKPDPILPPKEDLIKLGNLTENSIKMLEGRKRRRRNPTVATSNEDTSLGTNIPTIAPEEVAVSNPLEIWDGEIDINSNYTGFIEIIVRSGETVLMAYSDYFDVITPATKAEQIQSLDDTKFYLNTGIQVLAISLAVVVIFVTLWIIHHQKTKNAMPDEDTLTLRDSLSRALFGRRINNHSQFIGSGNQKGFDTGPIHKTDLVTAYKNRHKDTDYGFLREYEMLPNRFSDRTTKNSDMKENACKNRYPDIKAYDQTRVKLSPTNGTQSTDYINANFVIGYKERKKFICAQGPMETTINDFWRMIWEQHLEIIVMLTNLEEYNKSKCAKYWPERVFDSKQFGDISVKFTAERKTGDYIIRSLDVTKSNLIGEEEDHRQITQYHYLTWKDFMAPEHPHGIIKFIRQINSVYSVQRGPILVHCSAGVGRTGTLVALDSLVQQLEEESMVSIFNTVCDLRHQRNFLVQSLKQYIFLYRALLDTATYGNTDIPLALLQSTIDSLKFKPNEGKCLLETEFEKLISTADEINKTCSVGEVEENMQKNRSHEIIPYDRNRVILSPIPMRDNSTYINASFIEGYDNTESFIIAQDPMESTIGDFWRMISEQSVSTLITISEIGEGPRKCPRYWADDEIQYDQILVKYVHSESCPYYTRREFYVTNCKIDDTLKVTQFQYNGWPTVDGEVPEVCRGIIELVDQAHKHYKNHKNIGCRSPLTVHCSLGTDRSSIFVAMCILVQHLRFEKSVDICSTTRKLRSQRPGLLNSFAQYEFLHRAIINYSDLHKLSENIVD
ncbi:tyrosine-protein phosphatase 69D isoform X1 [Drosophila sulfurigaster albostrigata]|uniref:tyrosine-protein phosphatase 69D isoform X1 n=1 Tax=Drosophila sulfurigaster albostrigata TaxID=89887 RepID=UPI002D21D10B|nr:tyrosine-protein phosphatase 69D isoform X1 [Drosophila sulfurigaster albostrigata]